MGDSKSPVSSLITALNQQDYATIGQALQNWSSYPLASIKNVASEFLANEELASAIEKSLTSPTAGQKEDNVCRWLYQWYQIDTLETRLFVLRFIPQLLWVYLYNVANNEAPAGVEACLLCIYNVEVEQRADLEIIFHPPTLSLPSYLHNKSTNGPSNLQLSTTNQTNTYSYDALAPPASNAPGLGAPGLGAGGSALTENALRQFNKQAKQVTVEKALRPIGVVTSANRGAVVKVALQRYNGYISLIPPRSWVAYCKMCKRLVNFGFDFTITPLPLLRSKSFSKKYIEEDMDNLAIDSDEEFEDDEDDFPDEFSDTDGEKEKDVEKTAIVSPDPEANGKDKKVMRSPGQKRRSKHPRDPSSSNLSPSSASSSPKIPPLNITSSTSSPPRSPAIHGHPSSSPSSRLPPFTSSTPSTPTSSATSPPLSPASSGALTPISTPNTSTTNHNNVNNNNNNNNNSDLDEEKEENEEKEEKEENGKEKEVNIAIPSKPPTRIVLSATSLQEMIFKESYKEDALKALRKIHLRACFDLMPEIILSANALLHLEYQERNKPVTPTPGKTTPRGGVNIVIPTNPVN